MNGIQNLTEAIEQQDDITCEAFLFQCLQINETIKFDPNSLEIMTPLMELNTTGVISLFCKESADLIKKVINQKKPYRKVFTTKETFQKEQIAINTNLDLTEIYNEILNIITKKEEDTFDTLRENYTLPTNNAIERISKERARSFQKMIINLKYAVVAYIKDNEKSADF